MTSELPRASLLENARFTITYLLPSLLRGLLIPLPFWAEVATRLDTGRGVATVERLTERYAGRPVMLRSIGGQTLLVLAAGDVRQVLGSPVSVYAMNVNEKRRLFSEFAPDVLNGSPPDLHAQRRPFNEAVLDYGHEPHRLAEQFLRVVHEEVTAMLADGGVLDYERSLAAFRRISRRCALGDAAADDTELSEEHSRLRRDGDWLGLKVWNRRRNARLRASMDARIQRYVAAAEPGTLVSLFASAPTQAETRPNGQVPFWLMALDAVRIAVFNALALLTTDPAAHERALAEVRTADTTHGPGTVAGLADLAFVRACMLDSVRLWPAAAMLVRVTAAETEWYGETLPIGAKVLIPVVRPPPRASAAACEPVRTGPLARRLGGRRLADERVLARRRAVCRPESGPPPRHRQPRGAAPTAGVRAPEPEAGPGPAAPVRDQPVEGPIGRSRNALTAPVRSTS